MKSLMVLLVLAILFAGCVTPPLGAQVNNTLPSVEKKCRMVSEQQPFLEETCSDVSVTKPVCGIRALPYDMHNLTTLHLCVNDGECVGKPLGDCQTCSRAMTRCGILLSNDDKKSSGAWVVGANFSVSGGGFIRDPITKTLAPGESYEFDFQQMYTPGNPISSATCTVFLIGAPKVNDCIDETRTTTECKNVTKYKALEKQVCE